MKRVHQLLLVIILLIGGHFSCCAQTETNDESTAIFTEILRRLPRRDPESHAILQVRLRRVRGVYQDFWANFTIQELPSSNAVVITLWNELKSGSEIHERYRLVINEAIRKELQNQKQHLVIMAERKRKEAEAWAKSVDILSGGKLKSGMSTNEVKAIMGKSDKTDMNHQLLGYFFVWYSDLRLTFRDRRLSEITREQKFE